MRSGAIAQIAAMVVHDLNHASRYADQIVALREGTIQAVGLPTEVITPDLLRSVFGVEAEIIHDPRSGAPLCLPYDLSQIPTPIKAKIAREAVWLLKLRISGRYCLFRH